MTSQKNFPHKTFHLFRSRLSHKHVNHLTFNRFTDHFITEKSFDIEKIC